MADPTPTPSFDTAPRLQPTVADPASAYAPIAWSAVAALGVGGAFVLVLLLYGVSAFRQREPMIMPSVFVLPVVGIAVAFVSRRQIATSEGTRIGTQYAAAGWWLCVVGGLVYAAYLGTLEYTVRADAAKQFQAWTDALAAVDPDAPDQPEVFAAFYRTLPPQQRGDVNADAFTDATDPGGRRRAAARESMRSRYAPQLLAFRQHPILQQAARYRAECRFTTEGLREWRYQGGKIECTLTALMRTPEGDFPLVVPMEAMVDKGNREWQVKLVEANAGGPPLLTPYGFLIAGWVSGSARMTAEEVLGEQRFAIFRRLLSGNEFVAAAGGFATVVASGTGAALPHEGFVTNPVVTLPGGTGAPLENEVKEFRNFWESDPSRFALSGILGEGLNENPNSPVLDVAADRVVVKMPFQYKPRGAEVTGAGVRMKLILECTDPAVLADLTAGRASAASDPRLPEPAKDSPVRAKTPIRPGLWKVLRIESDLKIQRPPQQGPGGPGGPPGMMGG